MEEALEEISAKLGVEPIEIMHHIQALPKAREMEDLIAQIAGLFKENVELKTPVADQDTKVKETEALTAATVEEKVWAEADREKAITMAKKFHAFVGFAGDVVTKARLYDQCMKKSKVVHAWKILRMLVDFSGKVEKLLGELRILLQHDERGQEVGPSERRSEPDLEPVSRTEPASLLVLTPGAPTTGEASAPIPQPEALED